MKKILFCVMIFCISILITGCTTQDISTILDAPTYAKISTDDLITRLGEPKHTQEWTSSTSNGNFTLTTYDYDVNGVSLSFITHNKTVVKVYVNPNEVVNYRGGYDYIFKQFGISVKNSISPSSDTDNSLKFDNVSNTIQSFDVFGVDKSSKTYEYVYITFDKTYFN